MSERIFVDANVFLRFFADDSPQEHRQAAKLFQKAINGEINLVTGPPVLFEVARTLRSAYRLSNYDVLDVLERIVSTSGLELIDYTLVAKALQLARRRGGEFADAYIAASVAAGQAGTLATFNVRDFAKLGTPLQIMTK